MPIDDYTAADTDAGRSPGSLGVHVPGLWESIRKHYLEEIERGDMRGFGMTERQRAKLNASPNSTVSQAKNSLASMDAGEPYETWPPNSREFPCVARPDEADRGDPIPVPDRTRRCHAGAWDRVRFPRIAPRPARRHGPHSGGERGDAAGDRPGLLCDARRALGIRVSDRWRGGNGH